MAKLVSKTYGEALFELVLEKGTMDEALEELNGVLGVLKEHGELDQLLTHPKISKEEKISVMEQVFKGRISDDVLGFLLIRCRWHRLILSENLRRLFLCRFVYSVIFCQERLCWG